MRKEESATILIILIASLLALSSSVQTTKAYGHTVYINADGSITPWSGWPVDGDPNTGMYWFVNEIGDLTGVNGIVVRRSNIVIDGNGVTMHWLGGCGLNLTNVNNVTIRNISFVYNYEYGVYLYNSSGCNISIRRMAVMSNSIELHYSFNNSISGTEMSWTYGDGVKLYSSSNNSISDNVLTGSGRGVSLMESSDHNNIGRNVFASWNVAVDVDRSSSGNDIYHNNFFAVVSAQSANAWDYGYPSGGNYWSNYGGEDVHSGLYQNESCSDGLGDTPYVSGPYDVDRYPLMKPYEGLHDVGVLVSASKTVVPEGYNRTVWMNATVVNYGVQDETFNLTVQVGSEVQEQTLTLTMRNSTSFALGLNVSGWVKGNYTPLRVKASQVPGETDTSDNVYQDFFIVSILGDINGDGKVDIRDVSTVAKSFGSAPGTTGWNANCDVNNDAKVDIKDISIVAKHFGDRYP